MVKRKIEISLVATMMLLGSVQASEKLKDIVVTAKTKQSMMNTAGSITVINSEDIKAMNASSVKDALKDVVGLDLGVNSSSISGRQNISIRGTRSGHTLLLIDGKKVSGSDAQIGHSDFQYNWLPMNAIDKIEVIKGPMSAIYGSEAMGGVINIITKTSDKNFYGDIDVKAGTSSDGDQKDISLNIGGKITEKFSASLSVAKQDKDVAEGAIVTAMNTRTRQMETTTESKLEGKDIETGMLNLNYQIDDTQKIHASYGMGKEDRFLFGEAGEDKLFYDLERKNYSVGYSKEFDGVALDIDYYVTESDNHINTFKNNFNHNLLEKTAKIETDIGLIDNNYIVMGIENRISSYTKAYDSATVNLKSGFTDEVTTNAFFLQDEIEMGDLILTLGGRYDDHEKFGGEFSPKANIVYKVTDNQRLKVGYGEGFRAPTLTQGSSTYKVSHGPKFQFQGNDDLKPETSKSVEAGYEYYTDSSAFKATIFKTELDDMINTKMINGIFVYSNVESANMKGLELDFKHDIGDKATLNLGYAYLKTEDETTGRELIHKPNHKANVRVSMNLPADIKSTVRVNYTGKQNYEETNNRTKKTTISRLGEYSTVDMQVSKDIMKNLNVRLGVENLMDEEIKDGNPYDMRSRFTYLGLNYKF